MSTCVVSPERVNPRTVFLGATPVSLKELASRTGLTVATLSRIFSGKRCPSLKALRSISTAMDKPIDELLTDLRLAA